MASPWDPEVKRVDEARTSIRLYSSNGFFVDKFPPLCIHCGAAAAGVLPITWTRRRDAGGLSTTITWTVRAPFCSEHLPWYAATRWRRLDPSGFVYAVIVGIALCCLALCEVTQAVVIPVILFGAVFVLVGFVGLAILPVRGQIQATAVTDRYLTLSAVSSMFAREYEAQAEQEFLAKLAEAPPPEERPEPREHSSFNWNDVTG